MPAGNGLRAARFTAALVLAATGLMAATPAAYAGVDDGWGTLRSNADGTVFWTRATEQPGWFNRASDSGSWSFRHWSYAGYPLNCGARADGGPAYQFIYAQRAGDTHASLLETRRARIRGVVRRASSVFAASAARVVDSAATKLADHSPRIVTFRGASGRCQVAFKRVSVPADVWKREPYENYDNDGDPSTPPRQGIFAWLRAHGYDRPERRYVVLEQGPGVWNPGGGAAIIAADGTFLPYDDQPGPQNHNEAAGTWIVVSVRQDGSSLDPSSTGNLGEVLAHEWAHTLGAELRTAPHYNSANPNKDHPSDCADLLCYNVYDADGQHYDACGGASADTYQAFRTDPTDPEWGLNAPQVNRDAYRLDCGRDDYWGVDATTGADLPWTSTRWSTSHSRWLWGNPDVYTGPDFDMGAFDVPPECAYDPGGWCPDGTPNGRVSTQASTAPKDDLPSAPPGGFARLIGG